MHFVMQKKKNKQNLKIKEKQDAQNMFFSLACDDKPIDFFEKLALTKHKNVVKHKDFIIVKHENEKVSTLLYADFSFQGLTISRFMEIYNKVKKAKVTKIVICCKIVSEKELAVFIKNFSEKILIFDEFETYKKLYKYYNFFPEITHKYTIDKKMTFKDFVAYSFNKNRTKGYLISAIVLIISGLFVRTTIYYCIISSILVVFALISQFNTLFNSKTDDEVF